MTDERIEALLDPQGTYFPELVLLVDWVEQQRAIARYGYPKDNAFPEKTLEERLGEEDYVRALLDAAREEEGEELEELVAALEALLTAP